MLRNYSDVYLLPVPPFYLNRNVELVALILKIFVCYFISYLKEFIVDREAISRY